MILENRQAIEHKDAVRWLAPPDDVPYGIDYYQKDLSAAYSARHPGTCEWLLKQEKYLSWKTALPHSEQSFLWITAIPGAGKSTLAAFVTTHHLDLGHKEIFYFFFDSANGFTTSALSAGKCFLYQLYMHARANGESSHFELQGAMESSGGSKAKSFEAVWDIVLKYVVRLNDPIFIVDALDENVEPNSFLNALFDLVQKTTVRVLLTSRPSAVYSAKDSKAIFMEFGSDQRDDIETYIQDRSTRGLTSLPEIRSTVVKTLVRKNGGMFLWVKLVFEELESTYSLQAMELALNSLPTDLEGVYAKILKNLKNTLKQSQREFCHKILVWLFYARRPLMTMELFEAMSSEYANSGFLYTIETFSAAIRAVCGPLVVFRMDSIHLVHFSLKEFLTKSPAEWNTSQQELRDFHIDTKMGNLQIMKICLNTLESMASTENFYLSDDESTSVDLDISKMQSRWPLMEYGSFNWFYHAWQSGLAEPAALQALREFFECKASIIWVYTSLKMNIKYLEELRRSTQSLLSGFDIQLREREYSTSSLYLDDTRVCRDWCEFVKRIISDYGSILEDDPAILFDLDLPNCAWETKFRPNWTSELTRKSCERRTLEHYFRLRPSITAPAHRKLHMDVSEVRKDGWSDKLDPAALGLFQVIKRYGAFIYASQCLSGKPRLLIQECLTGRRLAPSTYHTEFRVGVHDIWDSEELYLLDSAISEDETRVALVYGSLGTYSFFTCVWHLNKIISFDLDPFEAPWSEVIFHTTTFQPIFDASAKLVLFASNDLLWCPTGLVDIITGSATAFAIRRLDVQAYSKSHSLTLYGKGDTFIFNKQKGANLQRISSKGTEIDDILLSIEHRFEFYCDLLSTDKSGRFIVWRKNVFKHSEIVLHDTAVGKYVTLKEHHSRLPIYTILFVEDPKLVVCATHTAGHLDLELSTWDISSSDSRMSKIASRKYREIFCGMCVSADGQTLYLVTTNRTITQLTLPALEERDEYLSFRGQHEEVIQTFPSADSGSIASIRSNETRQVISFKAIQVKADTHRVDIKIWDLQLPSKCRNYYYQPDHIIPKSSEIVLSPNFEWIYFSDIEDCVFLVTEQGLNAAAETEQDSPSQKTVELDFKRSIYLNRDNWIGYSRSYEHVYFSPCGQYTVIAMDSCQNQTNTHLLLFATKPQPRKKDVQNVSRIDNVEMIGFLEAKVSVNFDRFNPVCFLTFWTKPDTDKAICTIHCFVLDLKRAVITHLQSGEYCPPFEHLIFNSQGRTNRAWISQLDMMERSVVLSKCGQYLALSATIGPEKYYWTVNLTPREQFKSENENVVSNYPKNPGIVEPKMTYWRQHRCWMSVYRQRILLHRSVRSATNPDSFSSLSCHVQLSFLPAYLADAKVWLIVPESNDADMTIQITTKENPVELWKVKVSWNMVVGKLKGLETEHEKGIVALNG